MYKCPFCNKEYEADGFCAHGAQVALKKIHTVPNPIMKAKADELGHIVTNTAWTIERVNDKDNLGNDVFEDDGVAKFDIEVAGKKSDPDPYVHIR